MAKPLSVFVNIGAKVGSSVGASASAVERRFARMGQSLKLQAAEAKAALKSLQDGAGARRGDLFDAAAMGAGLFQATKPAVEFEDALIRVGNTAEVYGRDLDRLGRQTLKAGIDFGVGGRSALGGLNDFLAAGESAASAMGALRPTLMLARTAHIENTEAAGAGIAVMQNLGVAATDLEKAFDRMTMAGKEGKFEIGDMAREFPRVTASAQKLGFAGVEGVGRIASMLQITRQGAKDSEQAANDLYNLFEKMTADETVKNFEKMGVSLPALFKEAEKTGASYFDLVLDRVSKLSKGGENPFVLNELFGDLQARNALTMLIKNRAELDRITAATQKAAGVLEGDWERVQKSAASKTKVFKAQVEGLGISLGRTVLPVIGGVAAGLGAFLGGVADFADAHPALTTGLVTVGGALVALRVGAIGAAWASGVLNAQWLIMKGHALTLGSRSLAGVAAGFGRVRGAALAAAFAIRWGGLQGAGALLLSMLNPLRLVRFGLLGLRAAVIGTGIGAVLVGIAMAGMWIANNWAGISAMFGAFGSAFMAAIGPVRPALEPVIGLFRGAFQWAEKLVGPLSIETWTRWGTAAGTAIGGVVKTMVEFVSWIGRGAKAVGDFFSRSPKSGAPVSARPPIAGARARGGPVSAGRTYLVGERGPEFFTAPNRGRIIAAGATAAILSAGAAMPAAAAAPAPSRSIGDVTIVIQGAADPAATAREVERVLRRMASEQSGLYSD